MFEDRTRYLKEVLLGERIQIELQLAGADRVGSKNGKPLIYASLGTLVNGLDHVYKIILKAAEKLPEAQVVLSIGTNIDLNDLEPIPWAQSSYAERRRLRSSSERHFASRTPV
jgi:UDP:flavonoid glycosyltransferase YjiC (YdhE family)